MSECTAYKELEARIKELELRNTYLEQQEAQKQSRQLHINIENFMDTNFNAVAIINQKHRVVHANKKFAALLGYSQNEIYNLHTWDWESSMDGQKIFHEFSSPGIMKRTFCARHRRKDGVTSKARVTAC